MDEIRKELASQFDHWKDKLHLMPLEELKKTAPIQVISASFEILGPACQKTLEEMIYPLVRMGLTKGKVYLFQVSEEVLRQMDEKKSSLLTTIWSTMKSIFESLKNHWKQIEEIPANIKVDDSQDEEYTIITKLDDAEQEKEFSKSVVFLNAEKAMNLKKHNMLQNFNGSGDEPLSISFYVPPKKDYNNSFKLSNSDKSQYAPVITSTEFGILQAHAAEFHLVENKILVRNIENALENDLAQSFVVSELEADSTSQKLEVQEN